ncbi:D-2-hydroxyacid dehydrogenase [Phycisphaerales bacterium AB-hyl4]|uniref:D-2-hydroxyacid dehydrogenase n=1 Tax=Natronomicrosphaera hydrolytica TaxID=3242702 RepID=A0ABV4U5U9_9BACT
MSERIIVLDGYTLTTAKPNHPAGHGEPAWDAIAQLGELTVHDRTPDDQIIARARDASIVLTNKTPLTENTLAAMENLRYVGVLATGTNVVDLAAARQRDITVTNIPGYSTDSVAQHVFALLLEMVNHVAAHDAAVHAGQWQRSGDFSFTVAPLTELAGKTLGIVGLGAIGQRVAHIGHVMGMNIAAASRTPDAPRPGLAGVDVTFHTIDELIATADVLTLHCPLTPETHHLLDDDRLRSMKPNAYLINTGRGPLIDEPALAAVLNEGRLAGAGLDVLSHEPAADDHPLLNAPHCIITPHIAWASREARLRLMHTAATNLQAFLNGTPTNVVNQ